MQELREAIGVHTSFVSYFIPYKSEMSQSITQLNNELRTASNIKDRKNRQSVQKALRSTIETLKGIKLVPDNGIALFAGVDSRI